MLIKVDTIGYYHRDINMKVTLDALPRTINENRKYFENPEENPFPPTQWELSEADLGAGEDQLDSLLEYIRLKGWPENRKPHFVATRKVLRMIASFWFLNRSRFYAFRYDGVIFVLKVKKDGFEKVQLDNRGPLEEFFTNPHETDEFVVEKGVFMAELPSSRRVMYSAQLHSILENENGEKENCEIRAVYDGPYEPYFLENEGEATFWQSILGNITTLVIGTRLKSERWENKTRDVKTLTITEVSKWTPWQLYEVAQASQGWSISDGENRLNNFFNLVEKQVRYDGDSAIFEFDEEMWKVSQDLETLEPFAKLVRRNLKSMVSETSWMEKYLLMSLRQN